MHKEAVSNPYFRTCIDYILQTGTLDMNTAAMCLKFKKYELRIQVERD